jgi:hypothetical protein
MHTTPFWRSHSSLAPEVGGPERENLVWERKRKHLKWAATGAVSKLPNVVIRQRKGSAQGSPRPARRLRRAMLGSRVGAGGGRESGGRGDPPRGSERRKQRRRQSGAPTRSRLHQACLKWLTAGRTVGQSLCIDSVAMRQRRGRGGGRFRRDARRVTEYSRARTRREGRFDA